MSLPADPFTLAQWRRAVGDMYAVVRQAPTAGQSRAWGAFLAARNRLFKTHPQSPLPPAERALFSALDYYPYDPTWRVSGALDREVAAEPLIVELPAEGTFRYTRVARVHFTVHGLQAALSVFWIEGYGGGLFLPFRDVSSGGTTYGGGRYLYDTIKGADLGAGSDAIMLDFNYAYNPSCAYDAQWVCPLSPPENRLPFPVEAGEKVFVPATAEW